MKFALSYIYKNQTHTITESDELVSIDRKSEKNRVTVTIHAKEKILLEFATLSQERTYREKEPIFLNGYQSWTDSHMYLVGEHMRDASKIPGFLNRRFAFEGYGDSLFKQYDPGILHGWDISEGKDFFFGSVNYKNAYLIINHDWKNNRLFLESDIKGYELEGNFTLFDYFTEKESYLNFFSPLEAPKLLGYTSWYNYYQDINESLILQNLDAVGEPFDLFQIDDGYETFVGDWMEIDPVKFPQGLKGIVEKIHAKGMKAGIWLAPLIAEKKSRVYQEHPDWFLKQQAGSNWSGFYGMDVTNPEAMEYVRKSLTFHMDLGFDFFKLDFLYAVNLNPRKDKTRSQLTEMAYQLLRDTLQDRQILGCGAILSNSAEKFEYLRIGPDVSLEFDDKWYMRRLHRERISTKVTLQNTIYRSFLDGKLFANDPDVFLLRENNLSLTSEQRRALLTLNALFGSVLMTSDNVAEYDEEKKSLLQEALKLRKAEKKTWERKEKEIHITYQLEGKSFKLIYDTKNGILK